MMGRFGKLQDRLRSLKRDTYALFLACRDVRTPWYAKLTAAVVVAYAFSPIDLIPDFIPVLGLLDDLLLIPLGVVLVRWMVPAQVMEECRLRAESEFEQGKPVNWTAAVVIVVLWLVLAYLSYRVVRGWL
jgi:uncharacterized membrane protein YkvA (DUF1232 family)